MRLVESGDTGKERNKGKKVTNEEKREKRKRNSLDLAVEFSRKVFGITRAETRKGITLGKNSGKSSKRRVWRVTERRKGFYMEKKIMKKIEEKGEIIREERKERRKGREKKRTQKKRRV